MVTISYSQAARTKQKVLNLSIASVMALSGMFSAVPFLFPQSASALGGNTLSVSQSGGTDSGDCITSPCLTIGYAISQANPDDTIQLTSDLTVSSGVVIDRSITINGNGFTLHSPFAKTSNANNAAIMINHSDVTITNLVQDGSGGTNLHGINVYQASGVSLNGVTASHNGHAGLVVNGSNVSATSLNTSANAWGAVNVDPGAGVTSASVFTLNSGSLAEGTQIWSDGANVNGSATVSVVASGYNMYKLGGTTAGLLWTNRTLSGVATITSGSLTTLYSTIQAAVNAANPGDTINVAPGTYSEQLSVTKSLALVGADAGSTFIAPTTVTPDSSGMATILTIGGSASVTVEVSGFTVKGPVAGINAGIVVRDGATANIHNNSIKDIRESVALSGNQRGQAIWVGRTALSTTGIATINNNIITGYQKGGIVVDNSGSQATIRDNAVTGDGTTDANAQNGIQISRGATATMSGNTVSANSYHNDSNPSNWSAAGILLYQSGAVTVTGDNVFDNDLNIVKTGSSSSLTVVSASIGSTTAPATFGFALYNDDTDTITATNNWWGSSSPDFSSIFSGAVNYDPWYTDSAKTILSNATRTDATYSSPIDGQADLPTGVTEIVLDDNTSLDVNNAVNNVSSGSVVIGGTSIDITNYNGGDLSGGVNLGLSQTVGDQQVTIAKAVTLQSGTNAQPITLTNSELSNVSVKIDDGTTVLAGSSWDGKIAPPKTGTSTGIAPAGFSVGNTVIEVGSSTGTLLFDKAATILLTGVTGPVGYKPAGSSAWVRITTTCGGTYASPADPVFPGECAITDGTNTKIVTYHFTSFAGLNAVPPSSGGSSSSSSGASTTSTPVQTTRAGGQPAPTVLGTSTGTGITSSTNTTETPVVASAVQPKLAAAAGKAKGLQWYWWTLIGILAVGAVAAWFYSVRRIADKD